MSEEKEKLIAEYMDTHRIGDGVKITDIIENEDGSKTPITEPGPSLSQIRPTFR